MGVSLGATPVRRSSASAWRGVIPDNAAGTGVPTGAVPSFNNALAPSELFTRRARATGGIADIPYFALGGGITLDVRVRPVSSDSVTVAIAQQVERLKVDPMGRIRGGIIVGAGFEFARLGPEAADGLITTLRYTSRRQDQSATSAPHREVRGGSRRNQWPLRHPATIDVTLARVRSGSVQDRKKYSSPSPVESDCSARSRTRLGVAVSPYRGSMIEASELLAVWPPTAPALPVRSS
jgi:hypothetical protein